MRFGAICCLSLLTTLPMLPATAATPPAPASTAAAATPLPLDRQMQQAARHAAVDADTPVHAGRVHFRFHERAHHAVPSKPGIEPGQLGRPAAAPARDGAPHEDCAFNPTQPRCH